MARNCACGGSNENCAFCYGRGFIDDVGFAPPAKRKRKKGQRPTSVSASAPNIVKCSLCEFEGTEDGLRKHNEQWHTPRKKQRAIPKITKPTANLGHSFSGEDVVRCPKCKLLFYSAKLAKHMHTFHPMRVKGQKLKAIKQPTKVVVPNVRSRYVEPTTLKMVTCTKCGSSTRKDLLQQHLLRVHGIGNVEVQRETPRNDDPPTPRQQNSNQKAKATFVGDTTPLDRWRAELQSNQSLHQPNLDHTKPYAHAYREGGRFGSHPSHDSFDDESGA